MKIYIVSLSVLLCITACTQTARQTKDYSVTASPQGAEVFLPDWESLAAGYEFPEWFADAKFGIFIHWGVYAVPAFGSEWYPRNMYRQNSDEYLHHIRTYGEHTRFGYKDFIPMFSAEKFDAAEWVALFKAAGARYVVPVAEHHDGFSMYDSDRNPWNAVDMGPRKDVIGLLKQAAEKEGLVFGLSTHRLENAWFYNGGMAFPSDVQDSTITLYGRRLADEKAYDDAVGLDLLAHTHELIDKYRPQLIWFDWTVASPAIQPWFNKFLAYYYNCALDWGKGVVVNTKSGYPTRIQVGDVERGKLDRMRRYPWQTDTSIGKKSWSYIDGEENKSPEQIVHDLIDIVSKNGNLLLNIGPRADGSITEEQKAVLLAIGEWLKVNGEAIYATRCWAKSGEGNTAGTAGSFSDNASTPYTAEDIRFTARGNDLYAIVLNPDASNVLVRSLNPDAIADAKILSVRLLGSDEAVTWEQTAEGLRLSQAGTAPCDYACAFKITFDKPAGAHLESEMIDEPFQHGS
ncbi:MAG: alpha-L-fucosidase [Tannerellaceae bacterium]|jgi:alpha-L-fucosidase|nr:alpha-L-fucosidase [Tannerellaceae bacterium]